MILHLGLDICTQSFLQATVAYTYRLSGVSVGGLPEEHSEGLWLMETLHSECASLWSLVVGLSLNRLKFNLYDILILEQTDSDVTSSPQSPEAYGRQEVLKWQSSMCHSFLRLLFIAV